MNGNNSFNKVLLSSGVKLGTCEDFSHEVWFYNPKSLTLFLVMYESYTSM